MSFFVLSSYFKYHLENKNILKYIFFRSTSSGLDIWSKPFQNEYKFEIQKYWKDKIHEINDFNLSKAKRKFYVLSMFPYPSGFLHLGHVRVYVTSDTIARFYRMQGKDVIHPMGWDAFGLPAENAAIKHQIHPLKWTKQNIKHMRKQLFELGCTFDVNRELNTCDPLYYRWTQELFLKLYENGLVYKKEKLVHWDPIDKTVLADEQIDINNRSWRSGAIVEKRLLNQWFIKTTAFAKSLLEGLNNNALNSWRDIIAIQKHWIGKCTGTQIDFQLITEIEGYPKSLTLWTNIPEYIESAKFVAIFNKSYLAQIEKLNINNNFVKLKAEVINPFTNEKLPIYVTDKEIITYPDGRDDYLGIPISSNLVDCQFCKIVGIDFKEIPNYSEEKLIKKKFNILKIAKERQIGGYWVSSKLQDWLISRQRYWGTPIPMILCNKCGYQPVSRDELPVVLPEVDISLISQGLKSANDWLQTTCSKCNGPATRETDTMDTFFDSSWYFMRFVDPKNENEMFSKEKAFSYLPVDVYIGGKEHATLHLYYARFVSYFLHHLEQVPTSEPFKNLLVQGVVMSETYTTKDGKYIQPHEVEIINKIPVFKKTNEHIIKKWEKMSKSKNNSIDPTELLSIHSIDTIRLLIMSNIAPTSVIKWSSELLPGILRWEKRLWKLVTEFRNLRMNHACRNKKFDFTTEEFFKIESSINDNRNYYLHGVTFNIKNSQQMSIAITKMQGLTKFLISLINKFPIAQSYEYERALATLIIMIAPLAPHFASGLWDGFNSTPNRISDSKDILWNINVLQQQWPKVDDDYQAKVFVKVNEVELLQLRFPVRRLKNMVNKDDFIDLLSDCEELNKYISDKIVTNVEFYDKSGGQCICIKTSEVSSQKNKLLA